MLDFNKLNGRTNRVFHISNTTTYFQIKHTNRKSKVKYQLGRKKERIGFLRPQKDFNFMFWTVLNSSDCTIK